jgi:acetyl-CoA carboxylase biotin carboxyl carrier protein
MLIDHVQQLSRWLALTDIDLLELRGPQEGLCLRRSGDRVELVAQHDVQGQTASRTIATASSVGVFLHAHPLRAGPLAAPGTAVHAGQVLGLLQIGALLLPVTAPQDGVVARMQVEHGMAVGYGTPLVELELPERPE